MTADNDIVERLRALSRCEHSDLSVGDEAAAEIVRLRGEADALHQCGIKYLGWLGVKDAKNGLRKDMADPEMVDRPAPAMPNGVEGLVALWRQQEDNGEERTEFDKGYEQASGECAEALEAALRAADNRDAAGVWRPIETAPKDNARPLYLARFNPDTGELQGIDWDGSWEAESEGWEMPQIYYVWKSAHATVDEPTHWAYQDEPIPPTPAAVPAGEAVAWLASDGEVFTDKESADRHSKVWGVNPLLTPLYTTPPAPVKQEGVDGG